MSTAPSPYRRHRFPPEIIGHAVYLYFRFPLSYREVEGLLAVRGIAVSYETVRRWCLKFGPLVAGEARRRRPRPGDHWHRDEVYLKINGRTYYLWRAVDGDGLVLDILLQERRSQEAAEVFLRRPVEAGPEVPRVVVTDKPASYLPAAKNVLPGAEHRRHKGLNNVAENSHQPTRQRERARRRFRSPERAQRFLEPFGPIRDHFCPHRGRLAAAEHRHLLRQRHAAWAELIQAVA